MSKVLVWDLDVEHLEFSEKSFPIYTMTEVGSNRYELDPAGELEGIVHPVTEQLIQLKKSFEEYGTVYDSDDVPDYDPFTEEEGSDIGVQLEMGTPSLGVITEDDEEWNRQW